MKLGNNVLGFVLGEIITAVHMVAPEGGGVGGGGSLTVKYTSHTVPDVSQSVRQSVSVTAHLIISFPCSHN